VKAVTRDSRISGTDLEGYPSAIPIAVPIPATVSSTRGLRLLLDRAGTYYLLPVGWNPSPDITYVLTGSDSLRVELVSSTLRSG
jgi:hypothetical protein